MNQTLNHSDHDSNSFLYHCWHFENEADLFTLIIVSICLPLTLLAVFALYSQIKNEHVAPVYVINLLVSDIVQICCMIPKLAKVTDYYIKKIFFYYVYNIAVMASIFSMTCISMERYLIIAWPVWYRLKRTPKVYATVCVLTWVISFFIGIIHVDYLGAFLILPFPLLIFFLVGTIRALSAVQSVSTNEKRRIVAVLVVVVFTYAVIYLPRFFLALQELSFYSDFNIYSYINFYDVSCSLIQLNPLTDLILYVLVNKWATGRFLARLPCCRKNDDEISQTTA